jgi:hypothetical protein
MSKDARFEAGKPADPTKNMSPEDAATWKDMNEEYGDKFKKAAGLETDLLALTQLAEGCPDNLDKSECAEWEANTEKYKDVVKDLHKKAGDIPADVERYVKETQEGNPDYTDAQAWATAWSRFCKYKDPGSEHCKQNTGDYFPGKSASSDLEALQKLATWEEGYRDEDDPREHEGEGSLIPGLEEKRASKTALRPDPVPGPASGLPGDEKDGMFEKGKDADPTKNMSPEDAAEWKKQNELHKDQFKAASENLLAAWGTVIGAAQVDEKEGRFEEGKPADPTKNMSPEDAAEWKKQHDLHKDEFKAAAKKLPTQFTYTIDMDERGEFRATVYGPGGKEVLEVNDETIEDGFMKHKNDLKGLADYLEHLGIGAKGTSVKKDASDHSKTAAKAPTGLYGFTKSVQSDCETCVRKLSKTAAGIAKRAYKKDEKVAEFLSTHANQGESLPARILVAALRELGPKVPADEPAAPEEEKTASATKTAAWMEWRKYQDNPVQIVTLKGTEVLPNLAVAQKKYPGLDPEHNSKQFTWATKGSIQGKPAIRFEDWATEKMMSRAARLEELRTKRAGLLKEAAQEKEAGRQYGLYGYLAKTANLGLSACTELRENAGQITASLHGRRADRHQHITGFLENHAKTAKCLHSQLLRASYPGADVRCASAEKPASVNEWLTWDDEN